MDTLNQLFEQFGGGLSSIDRETIFLFMVLVSSVAIVLMMGFLVVGVNSPLKRKLNQITHKDSKPLKAHNSKIDSTLESIAPLISPSSEKERESIRYKLMHAGFHQSNALTFFYSIKVVSFFLGGIIAAMCYLFLPTMGNLQLVIVASLGGGLFLPNILLSRMVNSRQQKMKNGVPDALDLLVVCTESGLGFNASLRRVGDELVVSHPELADELDTVCVKIKAGVGMPEALNEMVIRTGLVDLSGLVSMLSHASRIGGSLAQTLRDYNEDYRDRRQQEAEEIAAKIPAKMIFPMMLCIWPCFFIVALGPAIIALSDAFGS